LKEYEVFSAYYPVSIDATRFFSSQKRSCPTYLNKEQCIKSDLFAGKMTALS
jgi:hypothetical protein